MKSVKNLLCISALLLLLGCSQHQDSSLSHVSPEPERADAVTAPDKATPGQTVVPTAERKLIKEGYVDFETDDLPATRKKVAAAAQKYQAYISSEQENRAPGRISNTLIIRVPAGSFDNFLADVTQGITHFDNKHIEVKDVTEEFLDVEARLTTKKELETRYRQLLVQAKTVKEILEIEQYLNQLRSDIEAIEGRLKYLQNQVSYSTLTLTYYQEFSKSAEFGNKLKDSLRNGWENLIWFFFFLTDLWPFVLIGLAVWIGVRIWKKRRKRLN